MRRFSVGALLAGILAPCVASAHEVYVLDAATIAHDLAYPSPNPFNAFAGHEFQFFFWGFIVFLTTSTIFCMTLFHLFEERFFVFLQKLKHYAPLVTRVTLGACLIACAYNGGLFGPELPLTQLLPGYEMLLTIFLYVCGLCILFGWYTRPAALGALALFGVSVVQFGTYMLTYANYVGEMLITLILGAGAFSAERAVAKKRVSLARISFVKAFEPYAFLCMRIGFGISVIYASIYAKFLHSNLALDTVLQYHLTRYFHFEPLFIVLGAGIIEILIGIFIIVGIELRWTALFFLFWLALSLSYFGESVWPHLVLLGLNLALLFRGYDRYTLEGWLFKKKYREPLL